MNPVVIGDATLYLGDCMEILPTLPKVDAERTGRLEPLGEKRLGGQRCHYWRCVDCGSDYPGARCNGQSIGICPWCRPDSRPWQNGRGL